MSYLTNLLAANALCISSGGAGGHLTMLAAINELCTLQGVTAGHDDNLSGLNALDAGLGGTGTHKTNLAALNSISQLVGGSGGYSSNLDAWNGIIAGGGMVHPFNSIQVNLVNEGHSFAARLGWPFRCAANISSYYNSSVSGAKIADVVSRAATVDGKLVTETDTLKNVLSLYIGINDFATVPVADMCTALLNYVNARVTAGWKVIVFTATPVTYSLPGRAIYNSFIVNTIGALTNVRVVNTDLYSEFDTPTDLDYYEDGLHPCGKGVIKLTELFAAKLNSLLRVSPEKITVIDEELLNQQIWNTAAHSYWDRYFQAGWSGDGSKLTCSGTNGVIAVNNFWIVGRKYKITVDVTVTSGSLSLCWDGTNKGIKVYKSSVLTYYYVPAYSYMFISAASFVGDINSITVKDVSAELEYTELVPSNWYTSAYWSTFSAAYAQGSGLISVNGSGNLVKNSFFVAAGVYVIYFTVECTSGTLSAPHNGSTASKVTRESATYRLNYTSTINGHMYIVANSFVGNITNIRIKKLNS